MRDIARAALLALNLVLLASPLAFGASGLAYLGATILIVFVNVALIAFWDELSTSSSQFSILNSPFPIPRSRFPLLVLVIPLASVLVFSGAHVWLHQILVYPNDAQRADMLIVIQQGIRRMLQGRNPYAIYKVPWDATLPYGPLLWAPFILPYLLHADVRFVTILGELFVAAACAITAVAAAAEVRVSSALAWILVLAAIVTSAELRGFTSIGHTPAYWPLLAAFAWLVAKEQWSAAAVAAGLLIVARTTMASMAPVLVMAVWHRDPSRTGRAVSLLAIAALLPFLPFALWDWPALKYALYGSYESVMKGFVWTSTDWVQHTVGVTGLLLRAGWQQAAELVQIIVLLLVYVMSWRALERERQPLPWMGVALLAFSMTTLWPVGYIYLDVFLLLVCAALADSSWLRSRSVATAWMATLGLAGFVLIVDAWMVLPRDVTIDVGTAGARPAMYAGFSNDEGQPSSSGRTFAWIDGARAEMLLPRRSRRDADLDLVCQPHSPRGEIQEMSVALNGTLLGTVQLSEGWQTVSLPAPAKAWQIGVNKLTLSLSNATSPRDAGLSDDTRKLSLALDRLSVRTR